MIYFGRVVDNSNFSEEGTIEVLLSQRDMLGLENKIGRSFEKNDLAELQNYLPKPESRGMKQTVSCLVSTPLGAGYNTGMLQLPQVNSVGIVSDLQDYDEKFVNGRDYWGGYRYIWLGGIYSVNLYGETVNIPNDDTVSEDLGYEDIPLFRNDGTSDDFDEVDDTIKNSNYIKRGEFIIKTKSTYINNIKNPQLEEVDFKKIPGENTIVLNKDKLNLRHNVYDNYNKVAIDDIFLNNEQIKIKRTSGEPGGETKKEQFIIINDNSITISFNNKNNNQTNTLVFNEDGTVNLTTTSDVNIKADGNMKLNAKGTMELVSNGQMKITANNQNLSKILQELSDDVEHLKVMGSPSLQTTEGTSQAKLINVKTKLSTGYN